MEVLRLDTTRPLVREEILDYFELNLENFTISPPAPAWGGPPYWVSYITSAGKELDVVIKEIFNFLVNSDRMKRVKLQANDSATVDAFTHYHKTVIYMAIYEEIAALIRAGILLQINLGTKLPSYEFSVAPFDGDRRIAEKVLLTEYGAQFVKNRLTTPYYAEQYFDQLRQVAEPDEELKGYLTEGLACLRANLERSSAIILRLAAEHLLNVLIDATVGCIKDATSKGQLTGRIRKAYTNIEERANVIFDRLQNDATLMPRGLSGAFSKQLRLAFHAIRELGGQAAHPTDGVTREDVRNHYILFSSIVYKTVMEMVKHLNSVQTSAGISGNP